MSAERSQGGHGQGRHRIAEKITELPEALLRSLTWDRGKEMARHLDFSEIDQDRLDEIADELNSRPRETLGWATRLEHFIESVALTG